MGELWDIYDENRNKTGRLAERGKDILKKGEYHIVVNGIIMNSKKQILLSQRASYKEHGLKWECNGGSVLAGETSLEGILRELKEELGIVFSKEDAIYLKEIKSDKFPNFKDLWLFKKDINIEDITFKDGEAVAAKWVTIEELLEMKKKEELAPNVDFGEEEYKLALEKGCD